MDAPQKGIKLTPMMEQYMSIKKDYEKALLFYRMGDFYELFYKDAKIASKELQITLTARNSQADNPIPMAGVPHHSAESYICQLLEKGYTVAVCEQVSDPKESKGLVERKVISVRTPGTAVEDSSLAAKSNNYLGSIYWDEKDEKGGFAWMEFSTGFWSGIQSRRKAELWQWVQKMSPRELLVPDLPPESFEVPKSLDLVDINLVRLPVRSFYEIKSTTERLKKAQNIQELGAIGLDDKEELTRACGAIVGYLIQTQNNKLDHLAAFKPVNLSEYMVIDEISERNLEIFRRFDGKRGPGTLWHILDQTKTPMGGRLLEERMRYPWREENNIQATADAVEYFFQDDALRSGLRSALDAVYDMERLTTRIYIGRSLPRDMVALKVSLQALSSVRKVISGIDDNAYPKAESSPYPPALKSLMDNWDSLTDIAGILEKALVDNPPNLITEGGLFKAGYDPELDELLDLTEHGHDRMEKLLKKEQQDNKLPRLKLGSNRVFGYFFELSRAASDNIPPHFDRRQTLVNSERFITPELKELEDKILAAGERRSQMEYALFQNLRIKVSEARTRILFMASALAALDYWQSLAEVARKGNWVRPEIHSGTEINILDGRHPVVEALAESGSFTPNNLHLDERRRLLLITGPNMSGKSTVLRQMAIISILAQMGSFVPASKAKIGLVDRVFSRVGASDNLAQGQSTFMVEMMETARILRQATKKSLVILDEIGRGTSTFDGLALAWAVVEDLLHRSGGAIRTLFATHYHELTSLEGRIPGLHNMNIAIKEWKGDIIFLHRLIPGPSDRSYGIEVAKLAGVPPQVVKRANTILESLEATRSANSEEDMDQVMEQMLPGFSPQKKEKKTEPLLTPLIEEVEHPILTALSDIDTNELTPMKALETINEWKLLWGGKENDKNHE